MTLEADHISVTLGTRRVLDDVSIRVAPGELVAVAGANGAGKSTALRVLAGLLSPDAGRVRLEGASLAPLDRRERGRQIAYLPQDRAIHWGMPVERVVALGRLPHTSLGGAPSQGDAQAVTAAMARMDVAHLAGRNVAHLSGGERARVLLARALAQEARYLIADEPAAGLDPAHALSLFETLRGLADTGKGVITALHDLGFAARYATRVVLFQNGRCMADGAPDEVLTRANLAQAFGIDAQISNIEGIAVFLPRSALPNTARLT